MKLAVAIIHGIGTQQDSRDEEGQHAFAQHLIAGLRRRLGAQGDEVAFQSLYWASVLDRRQLAFLDSLRDQPVRWRWLRRIVTLFLGDASGYRKVSQAYDTTYEQVHQSLRSGLNALRAKVDADTPLVVLAHSLGGHIFSNFVWDQQRINKTPSCPLDPFLAMETLAGIVTFGCNIPLFTFAYDPIVPIRFPGHCLSPTMQKKARWLNCYAPADPLGYPLRTLPRYAEIVAEDLALPVGPWYKRHTPLSHLEYWQDSNFQSHVAHFIEQLIPAHAHVTDCDSNTPTTNAPEPLTMRTLPTGTEGVM